MAHLDFIDADLHKFGIQLPQVQRAALSSYCEEVERWNKKINLTALSGAPLVRRLVTEPAWIAVRLQMTGSLVDIGSGNGSPAIPFHIICGLRVCNLVEARVKRAAFLRHLGTTLRLPEIKVHRARFDDAVSDLGPTDWISVQAVALTLHLYTQAKRISGPGTKLLWITSSGPQDGLPVSKTLKVPFGNTKAYVFGMLHPSEPAER